MYIPKNISIAESEIQNMISQHGEKATEKALSLYSHWKERRTGDPIKSDLAMIKRSEWVWKKACSSPAPSYVAPVVEESDEDDEVEESDEEDDEVVEEESYCVSFEKIDNAWFIKISIEIAQNAPYFILSPVRKPENVKILEETGELPRCKTNLWLLQRTLSIQKDLASIALNLTIPE